MESVNIRDAKLSEAADIATLHATSWMSAYRGLLSDEYLDNDLEGERKKYWLEKMPTIKGKEFVLVAEHGGELVGFAAVLDQPDAGFDALVDNLHVRPDLKGLGIGSELLRAVAKRLLPPIGIVFTCLYYRATRQLKISIGQKAAGLWTFITHEFGGQGGKGYTICLAVRAIEK